VDTRAGDVRVVKKLNEFVEMFRELHMGVHNDIMKLKTKGYGPQTFGGRDDSPILGRDQWVAKTEGETQHHSDDHEYRDISEMLYVWETRSSKGELYTIESPGL
jgi:hypothetical protein